jgi:hypothetical protein
MHVKRLTLIGIAAVAAGYAFLSNAGTAADGPRKPAPATVDAHAQACAAEQVVRDGYRRVCDADLAHFDVTAGLKPLPLVLTGLDFKPVDLADTPLNNLTSLGAMAETVGTMQSRLYRSFRMPDGHAVTLVEHDMSADGSGAGSDGQDAPERINDMPARLEVLQAGNKAMSILSWQEGRRDYQLRIDANAARGDVRQQLFALAVALPKSVPARTDEPVATAVAAGPEAK